jgi:hypothetical protein
VRRFVVAALASAWMSAWLAACGHRGTSVAPPSEPTAEPGKLPKGPPLVTPGERMHYKVALQGFELATYTFTVGSIEELDGRKVIAIEGHAKATGLASHVANVDDRFTSWIDIETGLSIKFQSDELVPKSKNIEHSVADIKGRRENIIPITFHVNDEPGIVEEQVVTLPETYDFNSFIVAIRAWEGPPGTKASVESMRSRYLWNITTTIGDRGKLATELGEFPVVRFDAKTFKLGRKGNRLPDEERNFSVHISDDDGRVPLMISAKTDYGDIKMTIVDYQPGTGQRVRP